MAHPGNACGVVKVGWRYPQLQLANCKIHCRNFNEIKNFGARSNLPTDPPLARHRGELRNYRKNRISRWLLPMRTLAT